MERWWWCLRYTSVYVYFCVSLYLKLTPIVAYHLAARQSVSMKIFLNKFVVIMAGEAFEHSNKLLHIKKSYNIDNLLDAKSRNTKYIDA